MQLLIFTYFPLKSLQRVNSLQRVLNETDFLNAEYMLNIVFKSLKGCGLSKLYIVSHSTVQYKHQTIVNIFVILNRYTRCEQLLYRQRNSLTLLSHRVHTVYNSNLQSKTDTYLIFYLVYQTNISSKLILIILLVMIYLNKQETHAAILFPVLSSYQKEKKVTFRLYCLHQTARVENGVTYTLLE